MVTKEHHYLSDLLIRNQFKDLPFNILAVIGNHDTLRELTEKFNIPFHYLPAENITREAPERQIAKLIKNYSPDYLILAKFMRILNSTFSEKFNKRIINIHHSFLPAFIGANPHKKAYRRGVKIIGATAHFVTDDLDEDPIIFQDITLINHTKNAQEMAQAGRDVERMVLAKALELVLEDRVFIHKNKTIIFE